MATTESTSNKRTKASTKKEGRAQVSTPKKSV